MALLVNPDISVMDQKSKYTICGEHGVDQVILVTGRQADGCEEKPLHKLNKSN